MKLNARWASPVYPVTKIMKKHSRTGLEIQSKESNEKIRSALPDHRLIEQCQPKQKKSSRKIEKLKQLLISRTQAFTQKTKFDPFTNTYLKNMLKANFCPRNRSRIISARLEKNSPALEYRSTPKMTEKIQKKIKWR